MENRPSSAPESNLEVFTFTEDQGELLDEVLAATGRKAAGWHYCLDYAFALRHFDPQRHHRILDIGCGPTGNALHDYLESKYDRTVHGLDRVRAGSGRYGWPRRLVRRLLGRDDHPDFEIEYNLDLLEFHEDGWDLILAMSSLEHNQPDVTRQCWRQAYSLLAPGGLLIATFALAGDDITAWNPATEATDLSVADAQEVWACSFVGDIDQAVGSYDHPYLRQRYAQRFGGPWREAPAYLAAGVVKSK